MKTKTRISDIFAPDAFRIEKIIQEYNFPQKEFLVRVNNYQYIINYREMNKLCNTYGINFQLEISDSKYIRQSYDNRNISRKYIAASLGKKVDFSNTSIHAPYIDANRVISLIGNRATILVEEIENDESKEDR